MTTTRQIDALKAGRIDTGIDRLHIDDDQVIGDLVREEAVVSALPAHHRASRYIPLSDKGVSTPIIMNRRRDDDSELTNYFREIVRSLR